MEKTSIERRKCNGRNAGGTRGKIWLAGLLAGMMLGSGWAGEARGQGGTPAINPEYLEWMQQRREESFPQSEKQRTQRRTLRVMDNNETELTAVADGLVPTLIDFSYLSYINQDNQSGLSDPLPEKYDPRPNGVTPVRQQDPQDTDIGTCWAQASVGSMESWLAKQGTKASFSVKNMVNREGWDSDSWYGGNFLRSGAYLFRWNGPVWEKDDPYTDSEGIVDQGASPALPAVYHVQQSRIVPKKTGDLDNDALKRAVREYGGLYVPMLLTPYSVVTNATLNSKYFWTPDATPDENGCKTYYYKFWNTNGAFYTPLSLGLHHAVTLVGWDDNYPKENFYADMQPPGDGAFIVKDSYGNNEPRDNGYLYVSYYDKNFAYGESCAFPLLESTNNYGGVYQYDDYGHVEDYGISAGDNQYYISAYGANIFTADKQDDLAAVGFYANAPNTQYKILIYTGCKDKPVSGTLRGTTSGTTGPYAGFYTIPLSQTVPVKNGERFSAVVWLKTPQYPYPLAYEAQGFVYGGIYNVVVSDAHAESGQSFFSLDAETWYDFTKYVDSSANFCCKVYTTSKEPEKVKLTGVAISSGPKSVESGKTGTYTCKALYDNGTSTDGVKAMWSVVKGKEWASIDGNGVLTAKEVTANQTVTIRASYTEDGVTKTADGDVTITVGTPPAPQNMKGTGELGNANARSVGIAWNAVSGATGYAVYRRERDKSGDPAYLREVSEAKCSDTTAVPGVVYLYSVKAKWGTGNGVKSSNFSEEVEGWRLLTAPVSLTATTDLEGRIEVGWEASEGATHYRVERKARMANSWTIVRDWTEGRTFVDETVDCGYFHEYRVSAALDGTGRMAAPGLFTAEGRSKCAVYPSSLSVKGPDSLGSGETGEYEAFVVYTDGTTGTVAKAGTWSVTAGKAESSVAKGRVTAPTVTANTNFTVSVSCNVSYSNATETGFSRIGGAKTVTVKAGVPGKVSGLRVTSATAAGVGLAWDAAAGASGYVVGRQSSAGKSVFNSAGTSWTDATAVPGVDYEYTVRAENAAGMGAESDAVSAFIELAAPGNVTATRDRTDGVLVKWGTTAGASLYRVGRAESEGGAKTELGSWQGGREYLDTTIAAGKAYWYFVEAGTDATGLRPSDWSAGAQGMRKAERTLSGLSVSGPDRVGSGESAVYSCLADWSDGTSGEKVSADWSALGGSIGADGRFVAVETAADVEGRVVASFGGMTATQKVTVVGTSVEASASVSGVTARQRWPFAGLVDIGYTLETQPAGTKAAVSISAWDEDHGRALAARSLAGDGADGAPLEAGSHQVTWNLAADYPGFHAAGLRVDVAATVASLAAPVGVTARGATPGIAISWSAVEGAEAYEVWRGTIENDFDSSEKLADATGLEWLDATAEFDVAYYYWVCAIGSGGYHGMFSDCVYGCRVLTPTEILIEGDDKVGSDEYIQYKCLVKFGDVDETYVTPTWSIVGGTGYATVYADGRVRTSSFSSGQSIVLQASYVQNGTEVSTTKTIQISSPTFTIVNGVLTAVSLNGARQVSIPSTVTSIGSNVFAASAIASVTIPQTVTNIGYRAFSDCTNLASVSIPASVEHIGNYAFYYCTNMASLTLSTGLKSIGADAFRACYALTDLELPTGFSQLGEYAFCNCIGLTNLVINDIDSFQYSFAYCTAIESVSLPASLKTIIYAGSPIIPLSANLKRIDVDARNEFYTSVNGVLYSKNKATLYFVPRNVTAFSIPAEVTTIHKWAFENCNNLKSLTIPAGVTAIGQLPVATLDSINVASGNTVYSSKDGILYDKDQTKLLMVPKSIASISIPSTVLTLSASVFENCTNLASLTIPDGVTVIPTNMCSGCMSLATVTLPTGVSSIGNYAFENCTALRNLTLPSGVKTIGTRSFRNCPGISHISLQSGALSIGDEAFSGCSNLIDVFLPSSVTNISYRAFLYCTNLITLSVDAGNERYVSSGTCVVDKNTGDVIGWAGGAPSVVVPEGAEVFTSRFVGMSHTCFAKAKSVTLPSTLKRIYKCGFIGWTELEQVEIPSGVETVDARAFQYCPNLVAVTIPETVTSFSLEYGIDGPFVECPSLRSLTLKGALDSYDDKALLTGCPSEVVIYVTSKWTGPTDEWFGRRVVVLDE